MFGHYDVPSTQPPMHRWQGASGQWYFFSIYPITAVPSWITDCNYVFARPRFDVVQSREPFYIGKAEILGKSLRAIQSFGPRNCLALPRFISTSWRSRGQSGLISKLICGGVIGRH